MGLCFPEQYVVITCSHFSADMKKVGWSTNIKLEKKNFIGHMRNYLKKSVVLFFGTCIKHQDTKNFTFFSC